MAPVATHSQAEFSGGTRSRNALVLGGSGDIGSSIVERLSSGGWDVAFTYSKSEEASTRLASRTGARAIRCDATSVESLKIPDPLGALIYCIGINPIDAPISETPESTFRETIDVNVVGAFRAAQLALPFLVRGLGTIVHVSSIWGIRGIDGISGYVTSKHAMRGLTASLARELAPSGVTCNEVCPGPVDSAMLDMCIRREIGEDAEAILQFRNELARRTPTARLVRPIDVAHAVHFLCSEEARAINGVSLVIDGGMTI